jgi:hypothetical protein
LQLICRSDESAGEEWDQGDCDVQGSVRFRQRVVYPGSWISPMPDVVGPYTLTHRNDHVQITKYKMSLLGLYSHIGQNRAERYFSFLGETTG